MIRDGLALVFAMAFPSVMTWLAFMVLPGGGQEPNPVLQVVFAAGKVVQFSFPFLYVWWFERDRIHLSRPTRRGLALGVGFGLGVGLSALLLYLVKDGELAFDPADELQAGVIVTRDGQVVHPALAQKGAARVPDAAS